MGYDFVPVDQVAPAASFIKTCLRFNPKERPSAKVLRSHNWVKHAYASYETGHRENREKTKELYGSVRVPNTPGAPMHLRDAKTLLII